MQAMCIDMDDRLATAGWPFQRNIIALCDVSNGSDVSDGERTRNEINQIDDKD